MAMAKKRIGMLLCMLAMLFALPAFATSAFAINASAVYLTDSDGTKYTLDATTDQSDSTWSWDAQNLELTLSGFEGKTIEADGDFTIILSGTNTLTAAGTT